ncbi:hypothetical protein M0802_005563 [Mischocyttarus mexicanus]|nr:hypothetical protein M0802_005563 [Mischocyttarus mexicanus]
MRNSSENRDFNVSTNHQSDVERSVTNESTSTSPTITKVLEKSSNTLFRAKKKSFWSVSQKILRDVEQNSIQKRFGSPPKNGGRMVVEWCKAHFSIMIKR